MESTNLFLLVSFLSLVVIKKHEYSNKNFCAIFHHEMKTTKLDENN